MYCFIKRRGGWFPDDEKSLKYTDDAPELKQIAITVHEKETPISIKQHDLYWKCIEVLRDNKKCDPNDFNWNTKEKCSENIKIICRYIKSYFYYTRPDTKEHVMQIITKSEGFSTPQKERQAYFSDAFRAISRELGITEDELIAEAKSRMTRNRG
jgi:hypothetical protein